MRLSALSLSMLALPLVCGNAMADWYEATGQAVLRSGDTKAARTAATEDAVRKALLYSGASIRTVQQVTDGLLTQESMVLQTQGEVQHVQIVSETEEYGYINVTIRADIYPDQNQCANLQLKKELLISPFIIENREQAIAGQLYELDQASTSLFIQKLEESSGSSLIKLLPQSIRQKELSYADRSALQRNYGGRYLLKASLGDVSLGERVGSNWTFWSDPDRERFYQLQLELSDIQEQKVLLNQKYQTSAVWGFRDTTVISPKTQRFWQTDYGRSIERVLNAAAQDVEEALRCETILADITLVDQHKVLLNLGSKQGLKLGDELTILHRRQHKDSLGQLQDQLTISELKVKVTELTHQNAWAQSVNMDLLANVQVGDAATLVQEQR
ncbi:flagellar assembly protein T N-terminal domain-containing protein [Rheinheimera sp. 1928-s]|uniref:flagellar assembly protein T N-terminal domain-containing protein n=1 Tax=Rheinheimera sp. 1928-s TaxID=3033803 RepID=UPI00261AAD8D|nr:flagellar assembly protein T N-terminal domain-containing protein [Rheinheimera sp. 1928-s]MDF3125868.1 flagellar assembly protein T N-terminal domain-containing protein [Rheinheimera sp. 1928-s]